MLLPGCQCCGTCDACTAECTNPHTGSAFAPVYTKYTLGVQAGNLTDGYLTAEGDNDTDDPVDGMDGSGPWYQRVSGGFTLGGPTPSTRLPCSVRVSFWRTSSPLGASSPPGPSTALTENTIEVIVTSGALVFADGSVITSADGAVAVSSVPSVGSSADPRTGEGTVSFASQCWNVETIFTVRATIRWNVQKRQHTLYGVVRECYEESDPCTTFCSGSPAPSALYLSLSNFTTTSGTLLAAYPSGTYVMDRVPLFCNSYLSPLQDCNGVYNLYGSLSPPRVGCNINWFTGHTGSENVDFAIGFRDSNGCCAGLEFRISAPSLPCISSSGISGTASWIGGASFSGCVVNMASGTVDWAITK